MGDEDTTPKMVPEADLLALKAKLKTDTDALQTQLTELQTKSDGHYTSYLAEQTAKEAIAAELAGLKKEAEGLRPITGLKEEADKKVLKLEGQLLDVTKKQLIQVFKVPEEKLKDKTLAELSSISDALLLVGKGVDVSKLDITGPGAGAGADKLSAYERIKLGFEQSHKTT